MTQSEGVAKMFLSAHEAGDDYAISGINQAQRRAIDKILYQYGLKLVQIEDPRMWMYQARELSR